MNYEQIFFFAIAGALGGFVSEYLQHGCLELPSIRDRKLYLGFFGGMIVSSICGVVGDHNFYNAFLYGLGGTPIMRKILERIPEFIDGDKNVICPKNKNDQPRNDDKA